MNPQLCETYQPGSVRWENGETRIVDPKIDGSRALFIHENGEWRCFSRLGKRFYNIEHIIEELQGNPNLTDCVLDGELWAGGFKATVSICRSRRKRKNAAKVHFFVFDYIDLDEWNSGRFVTPQIARKHALVLATHMMRKVVPVRGWQAKSEEDLERCYQRALDAGFEGIIVKLPDRPYSRSRTTAWLKMKPLDTAEFRLVGFEEGQNGCAGMLGALIVDCGAVTDPSQVGTGFTMAERMWIWKNRGELLARDVWVEVGFQGRSSKGRLRFPRFRGFRSCPGGDEIQMTRERRG